MAAAITEWLVFIILAEKFRRSGECQKFPIALSRAASLSS